MRPPRPTAAVDDDDDDNDDNDGDELPHAAAAAGVGGAAPQLEASAVDAVVQVRAPGKGVVFHPAVRALREL